MRFLEPLSGEYEIISTISETSKSRVFFGKRLSDGKEVAIKVLNVPLIKAEEILRFRREYDILVKLNIDGIIKVYDLREFEGAPALVLEYFRGITLEKLLKKYKSGLPLNTFLPIAIRITSILSEVHKRGVLHLDIKPSNILLSQKSVYLTDFDISRNENNIGTFLFEGTLPYMSPEQTGRTSFKVDHRSDLYSLGIVFYEMLSGILPFNASDIAGWIHAHLGLKPTPLHEISSCPKPLSDIVMKLLEKDPEKRYQNTYGLLFDLHNLYKFTQQGKDFSTFKIATRDFPLELEFSKELYGRDEEKKILLEMTRKVLLGSFQHAVIIGEKGVGKTFLINTVIREFREQRSIWDIRITFSSDRQNTSYHGLRQFLYDFFRQFSFLSPSEQDVIKQNWESKFTKDGKIITSFLPDIESIFKVKGEVGSMDQISARNKLFYFFSEFVRMIASKNRPISLTLDNIQYSDPESIALFSYLLRQNIPYLIVFTTFQGNKNEWESFETSFKVDIHDVIITTPWDKRIITKYLSKILHTPETKVSLLSSIILEKTKGNPLSFEKFISELKRNDLIYLDGYRGWRWDEEKISGFELVEDSKISRSILESYSEDIKKIISVAICFGVRFEPSTVAKIFNISEDTLIEKIMPLLDKKVLQFKDGMIHWAHPVTREGFYNALNEEERNFANYLISSYFLKQPVENYENKLYFVLERALDGIKFFSPEEINSVLSLACRVSEQNKISGAFVSTYNSLSKLLSSVSLESGSEFFFPLYSYYAKSSYYVGDYEKLEEILHFLKDKGYNEIRCFDLWILWMKALGSQEKYHEAKNVFYKLASMLSMRIPKKIGKLTILSMITRISLITKGLTKDKLIKTSKNTDPILTKQAELLISFSPIAYFSSPLLNIYINLLGAELSVRKGFFDPTPFFFMVCGIIFSGLGSKEKAKWFSDIAIFLIEEMGYDYYVPNCYFVYFSFLYFWFYPQHDIAEKLSKVYEICISRGEIEFAAYALMVMNLHLWQISSSLTIAREYIRENVQSIHGLSQRSQEIVSRLVLQYVDNITGKSQESLSFEGEWYKESILKPIHEKENDVFILRYLSLYKIILYYLHGDYEKAYKECLNIPTFDPGALSTPVYFIYIFFIGLISAKLFSFQGKRKYLRTLEKSIHLFKKWFRLNPRNYSHYYFLLEAELAKLNNKPWNAINFYGKAIESAHKNGYKFYEALGFELRSHFWESQGEKIMAEQDIMQAILIYRRYGAVSKTKLLLEKYPSLVSRLPKREITSDTTRTSTTSTSTQTIDFVTIMKASETLISETNINNLITRILSMVVENTGAEKGVFIYEKDNKLFVRAIKLPDQDAQAVDISLDEFADIPQKVINYAIQKEEELVVQDAQEEPLLLNDPYIVKNMVRSIIVTPVYRTGQRVGMVYLENNMSKGMFTHDRVKTIKALLVQASIALQNIDLLNRVKESARLETEMELAKKLQIGLLPKEPKVKGYEILGFMKPADEVGGDYYDVIDGHEYVWVLIGDVSGHGFASGQIMTMVQTAFQTLIRENPDRSPSELLKIANIPITYNIQNAFEDELKYVTINALQLSKDGNVKYAGLHQDIWIYRKSKNDIEVLPTEGIWLGVDIPGRREVDLEFKLEEGDIILLYTDGLTESELDGQMLENKPLEILKNYGNQSLEEIKDKILELISQCRVRDDITFLLIKKISHSN